MPPNNPYFYPADSSATPDPSAVTPPAPAPAVAAPSVTVPVAPAPVAFAAPTPTPIVAPAPASPFGTTPPPIGIPPTPIPVATPTISPIGGIAAPIAGDPKAAPGAATANAKPTPKNPNSTQNLLQLSELRDNLVIMSDGTFRAVITSKSINFDLMSNNEREGVEFSYQNFLNSLNFPIQIVVRSQRVDIGPYIDKLLTVRQSQDNMLLGVLMDDYIGFIDQLSQEANIMAKSFFIVVPYYPQGDATNLVEQGKGFFNKLFAQPKKTITKIDKATYEKAKDEIGNRVESVLSGLYQIGVQSVQLNTKELGELYYNFYNPDTAVREPLGNYEDVTAIYTRKGTGQAPVPGGTQ